MKACPLGWSLSLFIIGPVWSICTIRTVKANLIEGALLVIFTLFILLGNLRPV